MRVRKEATQGLAYPDQARPLSDQYHGKEDGVNVKAEVYKLDKIIAVKQTDLVCILSL